MWQISHMDQRIAEDDAAAETIEHKIYELNKPPLRKYLLVRITAQAD